MPNDVATLQPNPFEAFGDAATRSAHPLLKFSKGDFVFRTDGEVMPVGTEMVAVMDEFATGMMRWDNGAPTERIMGLVANGFVPPRRAELGDTDKALWERDDRGDPKDPWQLSNELPLVMRADRSKVFTFTTSSRGGISALGELCKAHGRNMRTNPDQYPVIRLDVGSYMHSNRAYGRIKYPVFEITGWVKKDASPGPVAAVEAVAADEGPKAGPAPAPARQASAHHRGAQAADNVPFAPADAVPW